MTGNPDGVPSGYRLSGLRRRSSPAADDAQCRPVVECDPRNTFRFGVAAPQPWVIRIDGSLGDAVHVVEAGAHGHPSIAATTA
jgi:hypothetical protein